METAEMFNIFGRKKATPVAMPKKIIYYKSNEDAFRSACDWMDTSLENENKVVAIVLHATGKHNVPADELFMVKLSNGTDPDIPNDAPEKLFGRVGKDIAFAKKIDNVPELTRSGNLHSTTGNGRNCRVSRNWYKIWNYHRKT
jgi:hypothetical protein